MESYIMSLGFNLWAVIESTYTIMITPLTSLMKEDLTIIMQMPWTSSSLVVTSMNRKFDSLHINQKKIGTSSSNIIREIRG